MSIVVAMASADQLGAWFATRPAALRAQLAPAFARIAAALEARVQQNLAGAVATRSGRLAGAIIAQSEESAASVALDPAAAPYGAALEFGASIPAQLIAVKNARALSFQVGGSQVFAHHVMHPAFALPPHPFLRPALAAVAPEANDAIAAAVDEAMHP